MSPAKPRAAPKPSAPPKATPEVVDPVWLLKALGICFAAALICGYATLCLLVYQGEWQLVLHPSHSVDHTPAQSGLAYTPIRFDASETGQPRLTGWWIPAASQSGFESKFAAFTVLYLHDGSGSLADTVPALARLHAAGLNIFAFDYRGFGDSDASSRPSNERMTQDTAAAFEYLTSTRHIPASDIVPYGVGLGASLAADLAQSNPEVSAVVLDNPDPDPASTAFAHHPSRIVPVKMLFGNEFDIDTPIAALKIPKLLIAGGPNMPDSTSPERIAPLFQRAPSPHFNVTLPPHGGDADYQTALARFLDQSLQPAK